METLDVKERLERANFLLHKEVSVLEMGSKIQTKVREGIDKTQREFFLREQLKAIQKELGEKDERTVEIEELRQRMAKGKLPPEALKEGERELDRLAKMPPAAAEYTVSRTYLDWLIELPWAVSTEDNLDILQAQRVLNEDHYDLEKVKRRILEYLSVRKLKADMKGPMLCFVGPPGTGTTSVGKSIAKALKVPQNFFDQSDIHIHVPAGAIPKDGPSAGVTMFTALTSLLTGRPVRSDVAMTGEITQRGLILPVGGIKEKVLAAKRAGIRTVILPKRNEKDLEEVPEQVKKEMKFHFVQRMDEVIALALKKKPKK